MDVIKKKRKKGRTEKYKALKELTSLRYVYTGLTHFDCLTLCKCLKPFAAHEGNLKGGSHINVQDQGL